MSDFRPMSECVGFEKRIIVQNRFGYIMTARYKDGMIKCDGYDEWREPKMFAGFIPLKKLANGANEIDDGLHLQRVSQRSELLLAFVKWLKEDDMLQYDDKQLVDWFLKANNCG